MSSILNATTTTGLAISPDNSGSLQLATNNGTTAVTIDTSQNVGIGVTTIATPSASRRGLQVSNSTAGGALYLSSDSTETNNPRIFGAGTTQYDLGLAAGGSTGYINYYTNGTERMRIDSSGNFLVGTTNTNPVANRVNGTVVQNNTQGGILVRGVNQSSYFGLNVTSGVHIIFYTDNGTTYVAGGNISTNGSSTSYNASSDYRMKENIAPMTGALAKVQQLKPCTYTWKSEFAGTNPNGQGFIAHELAEVCPQAVTGEKDAVDAEGKPQYQGIDTSFLVATLTAAIQELKAELDATKAEVQALKGV